MDNKAIVTGATGFVGKWLVDELVLAGYKVCALVRNINKVPAHWNNSTNIVVALYSINQDEDSKSWCDEFCDSQFFFHFAWAGTSGMERADIDLQLMNVKGVCDALRIAKRLNCKRFINAGSIMEYEAKEYLNCESAQPGMGYIYSSAKLTADYMARVLSDNLEIDYVKVIISNIYGAGEISTRFLQMIVNKMICNEDILLTAGEQLYDFIYVKDAVNAMVLVAEKGVNHGNYYIGNSELRKLKDFVIEAKETLNSNSELLFGQVPFNGPYLDYHDIDVSRLEKEIGFTPKISFSEGVLLTKQWICEERDK